jgi:hypothetical protein
MFSAAIVMNSTEDIPCSQSSVNKQPNIPIKTTFKLPITYLNTNDVYELSPIIANDLELYNKSNESELPCMYKYLFKPNHEFAMDMIPYWKTHYTTNSDFLSETSNTINNLDKYISNKQSNTYKLDCSKITQIWNDIKHDKYFVTKYNYLDWEPISYLNENSSFLQCVTVVQVLSPVISFIIPFLFIIFPFILLKIQGIPISLNIYIKTLKTIAKHHFIGKALHNLDSFGWDKLVYLVFIICIYVFQIYQNFALCKRFYHNVVKMNHDLLELQSYVDYSIHSMESFDILIENNNTYYDFHLDLQTNISKLYNLKNALINMNDFSNSFTKFNEVGYMLKCYYLLYSNADYDNCLRYSVGFEGYMNNILGIYKNINDGIVSYSKFNKDNVCEFKQQYYPAINENDSIKNNCSFDYNMIISAPNKSGKTTFLKTTALNIVFTQQTGCGFYNSATLTPYTHIHSYLNIPDTSGRDSLFQAESRRCKEIIDSINTFSDSKYRHFCLFDELYSGTNPDEASKSGYAFLKYLQSYSNVNFILTTHYISICKKFKKSNKTKNYKMNVSILPDGTFNYTYKIKKGISKIKGGVRVLKDMEYPDEIINMIETK